MTGLAEWLEAQIAEDERIAREVPEQYRQWECTEFDDEMRNGEMRRVWMLDTGRATVEDGFEGLNPSDLRHIARHDPARVLAECNAKRRIIAEAFLYEAKIDSEWGCCHTAEQIQAGECPETPPDEIEMLRALASAFEGRPGYQETWKPA